MKTKHTPEPWFAQQDEGNGLDRFILSTANGPFGHFQGWAVDGVTTEDEDRANAERVVACVNALRAFPDPAKDVAALIAALSRRLAYDTDFDLRCRYSDESVRNMGRDDRAILTRLTAGSAVES